MSLLAELKRRNVIKVGAAYLALGWLVLQLTSIVVPEFELPAGTMKLVMWLGVIGFPFVLIFSWAYELTPEGLKRDGEVDPGKSITPLTGRRLDYAIVVLLALAIGMAALQYFRPPAASAVATIDTTVTPAVPAAEVTTPVLTAPAPELTAVPSNDKSIAVLPFVNMSSDKEQEYFSDGISEELLNLLAKIPELKVIARTSSFAFKGKEANISEIAKTLNVAHVLEGSVRKSGNRVRITVQLIRTADSYHLWSEVYDRTLEDIFGVQEEIARTVVGAMKVRLLGDSPKIVVTSPEVYAHTLQAIQLVRSGTRDTSEHAIALYRQAVELDPSYPLAWIGLAWTYTSQINAGWRTAEEGTKLAKEAATRAIALAPDHPKAHDALGFIALALDRDWQATARHFSNGLELDPRDTDLNRGSTLLLLLLGRQEESIQRGRFLLSIDPLNPFAHDVVGSVQFNIGHWDEAIAAYRVALALSPHYTGAHHLIGAALLMRGDTAGALEEFRKEPDEEYATKGAALALHALGRYEEFATTFATLRARWGADWPSEIAQVYARTGEADSAFAWLDKSIAMREPGLNVALSNPLFRPLHEDPRWLPMLRRVGIAPEQLAAIKFDVKLPGARR